MPQRDEFWRTVRWLMAIALLLGGAYFLVVRPLERAAEAGVRQLDRGLDRVLEAVTGRKTHVVEGRAELLDRSEIAELALLELRMSTVRTFQNSDSAWKIPLGTKRLQVRGTYRVKVGYRLGPDVSLWLDEGAAVASFPPAEILSVELVEKETLDEDESIFNRLKRGDRDRMDRELVAQMRREAEASGVLAIPDAQLRTRLRDLLGVPEVRFDRALP